MKISALISAMVAGMTAVGFAAATPGVIGTDFKSSLAMAKEKNIPIAVTWGNTECGFCNKFAAAINSSAELKAWVAERQILLVEKHEDPDSEDADYIAAKTWIKGLNTKPKLTQYPFVGFYWEQDDGTVIKTNFTGREGMMPVTTPSGDLAGQFLNSLEEYFGDYDPGEKPTGDFAFVTADTENDRLEAESGTRTVYVPLQRKSGATAVRSTLTAKYPSSATQSYSVTWAVGVTNLTVPVAIQASKFSAGDQIALTLADAEGATLAASSIQMVAKVANAPKNPHWVGEYSAATLPYGEWTMDFDVAKEKVRLYGGKLVAMFGGPLWCPNCVAIEDDVFSTDTFKKWAKQEKLVLVHFDQGRASSPATPEGTMQARLLTLTPSAKDGTSGASYLSRHGIDPDSAAVKAVIARVTELTSQWLAPEATAVRLGNPTVLLLNDAGTGVDARFLRQNDGYTMDLDENMCRLKDLITLAGDDERKGYRTTTSLEMAADSSVNADYHLCSRKLVYALSGLKAGKYLTVDVASNDSDAQSVYVSLVTGSGEELATGEGGVQTTEPLSALQASGLYLVTQAYGAKDAEVQAQFFGSATSFGATVSLATSDVAPERIVPFASLTKAEQKELNAKLYLRQAVTVPVYEAVNLGGKRLVGTLEVSMSVANRLSAKLVSDRTVSFAGTWDEISTISGRVGTTLTKKVSGVEYTLELTMDATATFDAVLAAAGEELGAGGAAAVKNAADYVGAYTVTLVDANGETGTGSLTLKLAKTGKASVSGTMPDGTSISVSVTASENADGTITVPVYKKLSRGTLAVALAVDPNAAETWGQEGETDTVRAVSGCFATWTTSADTFEFQVYGGYWQSTTPLAICEQYGLSDQLTAVIDAVETDSVTATKTGFKLNSKNALTALSFTKSTGVFTGKAKVVNTLGKTVTATVKGVLLPGWIDCGCTGEPVVERPYGSGTLYYKVGKVTVSCPIDLVATEGD